MWRRKSGIWRSFSEITIDGVVRAKCDNCVKGIVSNPDGMQTHLEKCEAINSEEEMNAESLKSKQLYLFNASAHQRTCNMLSIFK